MKFLILGGLFLNFIGAFILATGLIKSPSQIEKESGTYWGHNPHLQNSMYRDRKAAIWGVGIMALGFILSFIGESIK